MLAPLPVDPLIPRIVEHLSREPNLVIEAPPGAGKTTRVPPALLALGAGDVLVLEPRRLAARMAARRVAFERGETVGETAGYQVRFETVGGRATRLWFLTEGVLNRRLLDDRALRGVATVVLDEFHERHLEGDFALALLRRLQLLHRPELRLVVMSATLDAGPVADFLGGCPVVRSEGRLHELSIQHSPSSSQPLEEQVCAALEQLLREGLDGDVLVFLPGASEIRRAMRACAPLASRHGLMAVPLHGDLSPEEQDRAVLPAGAPKVILSTNVAESSITIEGVTAVIDSGLARVASDSPWSGLPTLKVARVSRASAAQRAGRAGRTRPGRVIRLYPREDFLHRPEQDTPEITRRELSQTCLAAHASGVRDLADLAWLDPPPEAALSAAENLLRQLGALNERGGLTEAGEQMARLPLHPRLGRLIVAAGERGAGEDGCVLAALLSAGERLSPDAHGHAGSSDLLALLDRERSPQTRKLIRQVRSVVRPSPRRDHDEEALLMAVLAAFPDRVARRRRGNELLLAGGGGAILSPLSVVHRHDLMVAVDIEERPEQGLPLVRLASGIEPEWLLDMFPERIRERQSVEWNREAERVDAISALLFDNLVLEQSESARPDPEEAGKLLARKAIEAGIERFVDRAEIDSFLARVAFAARHGGVPRLDEQDVQAALAELCQGRRSFRELAEAAGGGGLLRVLRRRLSAVQVRALDTVAPEFIHLPRGRRLRVHYEPDRPPWVASRLQDFFGMRETPRIADGAEPVVIRLLAPNQRPLQTTTDLAGFWERLYPQVRRELCRRYPKHAWPEKPV
jgi:ATP-dependent helicase HrpB